MLKPALSLLILVCWCDCTKLDV